MKEAITAEQRDVSRAITPDIQEKIKPGNPFFTPSFPPCLLLCNIFFTYYFILLPLAYGSAAAEAGAGCYMRMKAIMLNHVQKHPQMFEKASQVLVCFLLCLLLLLFAVETLPTYNPPLQVYNYSRRVSFRSWWPS